MTRHQSILDTKKTLELIESFLLHLLRKPRPGYSILRTEDKVEARALLHIIRAILRQGRGRK